MFKKKRVSDWETEPPAEAQEPPPEPQEQLAPPLSEPPEIQPIRKHLSKQLVSRRFGVCVETSADSEDEHRGTRG